MDFLNFFGSIFGYLLWFLYEIFNNYGVAIIFFTIIVKLLMMPLNIKQQKSMANSAKFNEKQKELQKKYANNKALYNEEVQKLYQKEGANPAGGCLPALISLPIMMGIYYSVIRPLQNTLHIAVEKVESATAYLLANGHSDNEFYAELDIVRNWDSLKSSLTMFTPEDIEKIDSFASGFKFLGLDLLKTPQDATFLEFLWILPVLSFLSNILMQMYMNKSSNIQQPGCTKYMMYGLSLFSAYWAFIFPGAVGFYWVISGFTGALQSIFTRKFYGVDKMTALNEAKNYVTLFENEKKVKPLPANLQKQIAAKIESQSKGPEQASKQSKNDGKKKKSNKASSKNDYLGNKK